MTGKELGSDGRKPNHCPRTGPRVGNNLRAPRSRRAIRDGIGGCGEAAKLDCSRHPQPTDHRRDVEAEINGADRPFDQGNIHIEFNVIAALGIEGDFVAGLEGQGSRPGPGGENDCVRIHNAIATGQPDFPVALRLRSLHARSLKRSAEQFRLGSHPPGQSGGIVDMRGIREEQAARHWRKRGLHRGDFGCG